MSDQQNPNEEPETISLSADDLSDDEAIEVVEIAGEDVPSASFAALDINADDAPSAETVPPPPAVSYPDHGSSASVPPPDSE